MAEKRGVKSDERFSTPPEGPAPTTTTTPEGENKVALTKPSAAGGSTKQKPKRRCNWNPSIWFQIENVVKAISIFGFVVSLPF
jgi:hypothetical protein